MMASILFCEQGQRLKQKASPIFFLMPETSSLDVHLDMKGHTSRISKGKGNPL